VTLAARLADQAEGGEILTSSVVREFASDAREIGFEDRGALI
jgi:class 3 adenylate cyclase